MRPDILIVGQGLAGTLLAWELERAGIRFAILDAGHATAATRAAAGVINPITGRRLVKNWRYEAFFPAARLAYIELEEALGVPLWRELRIRRLFADERERAMGAEKADRAELAAYIETADEHGWWIRGAARVDLGSLLAAARARWLSAGTLRAGPAEIDCEMNRHDMVIDCRGVAGAESGWFDFVPWEYSRGELLELDVSGLEADVMLNRRHWVLPLGPGAALAGATHEPGVRDVRPSPGGRDAIETAAREILGPNRPFHVTGQRAGIRVNLPDKRPLVGRHLTNPRIGLVNGLGAKGALWAPMLAHQWVRHLTGSAPFDSEIDVRRFSIRRASV
jgi:glycine/D-amino acid oxidase-like deaminating enzyme